MNNYNNTTNNYMMSPGIATSTVLFDKPRLALFNGCIHGVNGMLLITSYEKKDGKRPSINTYRQLLLNENLRPGAILSEFDDYCFMYLPDDGILNEKTLKEVVRKVWSAKDNTLIGLVNEFYDNGIKFCTQNKQLEVHLNYCEDGAALYINSDAFGLDINDVGRDDMKNFTPADFVEVLELHGFTGLEFKFVSDNEDDKDIEALAAQLEKWMAIHTEGGLLHDSNNIDNCNDGEYTYTKSLGKIRMTREEFLKRFPDAYKF